MRQSESRFLQCKNNRQMLFQFREHYVRDRNEFDKLLHKKERSYKRAIALDIEEMSTSNPNEFWKKIEKLGPRKDSSIPMEVIDESGDICREESVVFDRWKHDFLTCIMAKVVFILTYNHFERFKLHKILLENNMKDPLYM